MEKVGLILEGGGMRGAFTAGVLDFFMEKGIWLDDVYGVSAGACQACSYLCGQIGRGLRVWTDYIGDRRYCSLSSLIRTGDLYGAEMSYDLIPNLYDPLDYAAFDRRRPAFIAVVTNVETGKAEYLRVQDLKRDVQMVRASASLPLVSNIVEIDGKRYLDGGMADSIPIRQSIADGHRRNVVVLTQALDYRKGPNRSMALIALRYAKYPRFVKATRTRHLRYNQALDAVEAERRAGRAFVIQPDVRPDIGRTENDPYRLKALHAEGRRIAAREYGALSAFLDARA